MVVSGGSVTILPDRKLAWVNGVGYAILAVVATLGFLFAYLLGFVDGEVAAAVPFFGALCAIGLGSVPAIFWSIFPGRVRYVCDGVVIEAWRGSRCVKRVNCAEVKELGITERATWVGLWFSYPILSWPGLFVVLHEGSKEVGFPAILLWGNAAADRAEEQLSLVSGIPVSTGW